MRILGFDTVVVPDHVADDLLSPMVALATMAEATTRLRVGTFVLNNDFRHPALLAREAATIDLLTDGRLELGLGAGHWRPSTRRSACRSTPPGCASLGSPSRRICCAGSSTATR